MAFDDIERKRIENAVSTFVEKRRPAPHIRPQLDIGFRFSGQSVEIFEIRPRWKEPDVYHNIPIAKATFVRNTGTWKIYWQRADLKWHSYQPLPAVGTIELFLAAVDKDPYGCFWG